MLQDKKQVKCSLGRNSRMEDVCTQVEGMVHVFCATWFSLYLLSSEFVFVSAQSPYS